MSEGQNYPSPTEAHNSSNGPFYGRPNAPERSPPPQEEIPDDLQLRADLARSLAPIQGENQDDGLNQDPGLYSHLAQGAIGIHEGSPTEIGPDGTPRQREQRHKVSKACDECRRKKIRCDAPDAQGAEPCSNCKRTNALCTYTRQQMKRGPSKGYIKQLADRLKDLEESQVRMQILQPEGHYTATPDLTSEDQSLSQRLSEFPPPISPVPQLAGQKRTHDSLESGPNGTESPRRTGTFSQEQATRLPQQLLPSQNNTAPPQPTRQPQSFGAPHYQAFWAAGANPSRRETVSVPHDGESADVPAISDWDDEVVDEYYRIIHQTFPLLPHSKTNLRIRLSSCPASLREAFVTVLGCMMRTFPSSNLRATQSYAASMKRSGELIAGYPFDNPATHTIGSNLVYLQTLLLMALECDNHGPATVRGQAGPSRAEWLGRAAGVAGQLEINLIRPRERFVTEGDPDSDERLARRVWWVLFILDRWHASSTSDLLKLPENSVVLLPEDQILLGESTYHLARLSFIIGHLASIQTTTKTPETNVMAPGNPASYLLGLTLAGEIDRFRESVESVWGSLNLVHLSYHHCHLLIKRLNPSTEPTELVGHAAKVAAVLNQRQTPLTPLNHQFGALAAMTLCELVDVQYTRDDALKGLDQLSEALGGGRGLAGHVTDSTGWDHAVRLLVEGKRAKVRGQGAGGAGAEEVVRTREQGNVAATAPSDRGRAKFDATRLTMYGYLTALGQGMFQT